MKLQKLGVMSLICFVSYVSAWGQTNGVQPVAATDESLERLRIKPIGDWQVDPVETAELSQTFSQASTAANALAPGSDWGAKRHAVDNALRQQLEDFLIAHPNSAYSPNLHLYLGRVAELRCGYSLALEHYRKAVSEVTGSPDPTAQHVLLQAGGNLARLLAVTGRLAELDALVALAAPPGSKIVPGSQWTRARELRAYVEKHPTESYKCGLYCLDMLGRLTQSGTFLPRDVTETLSSTNGFTAAGLLSVAAKAGLRVHAAAFTDTNNLPVPCVLHLISEHFVVLRERRGAFYEVVDPVIYGSRWLTADEIVAEASGCVLVSDVVPPQVANSLLMIDGVTAANYRGRCHSPEPPDHDDCGCPRNKDGTPSVPKGNNFWSGKAKNSGQNHENPQGTLQYGEPPGSGRSTVGCTGCGMPSFTVSEPFLNLWVKDIPLEYESALGLPVNLELAHVDRNYQSVVSGWAWSGAEFGNDTGYMSLWASSFLSFADLSSDGSTVDLMLPSGGRLTFTFPTNAGVSSINYRTDTWLEQKGPGPVGSVTNLVLHYTDGSTATYGVPDKSDTWYAGTFYMTSMSGPDGIQTQFKYDSSTFYLTNVTAGDGTTFRLVYTNLSFPDAICAVISSYGAAVSFSYVGVVGPTLTTITDAAGITSRIGYLSPDYGDTVTSLVTPYGTTEFSMFGQDGNFGVFDRVMQITNATGTQEFYGQMNNYVSNSWPDFAASQIPTNTPVGTLDKDSGGRQERNTFYWNAQQFASLIGRDFWNFDWAQFKQARIKHWLANTDPTYTHFDTISLEQFPSPDAGTTEGQITWYDYVGKPAGVDYEIGTQVAPAVIARVMPDASTWYQRFYRLPNGAETNVLEAWIESGAVHTRSDSFVYASNGIDLLSWTNALGVRAAAFLYNGFHQVVTNYDALGQMTTNGYDSTTHQITSSATPSGLISLYTYNGSHRLQSIVDLPVNRTNSYTWNSDGSTATHTDPRNMVETYFWDGLHRLTGTSDSRGTTTNLYYLISGVAYPNSSGGTAILDLTASRDRLGHWTSYVYDAQRRKIVETNVNGVITAYSYCPCGSVSSVTNAWNTAVEQVTTYNFDTQGRLSYTVFADNYSGTNWYDSLGRILVAGDGAANHWLFYNNLGLLTVRSNAYGAELVQSYDVLGRPVYITDVNGVVVTNIFDNLNRVLSQGYPDGGVERFGYSAKGLIAYTNQINLTNFYAYDELGRKTYETNANGEILKFTNNAAGDLLSLTDGKNQTTRWGYDEFGRVTNKWDQAGNTSLRYTYDAQNRMASRWSWQKTFTFYTNDAVGNLTFIKYPSGGNLTFQYDALNRLTNMVDWSGTTRYTYTAGNQLLTEDGPFVNDTITNTYVNRVRTSLALQQPAGLWTNKFVYDPAVRLTNVTSPAGAFNYVLGGGSPGSRLVKRISLPNTSFITNIYGSVARLSGTYLDNSANAVLDSAVYGYNWANQRTVFTNAGGTYVQYAYDKIGQLKVATSSVSSENRGYAYDAAWNLNYRTNNGTAGTFTVDGLNQLTSEPPSGLTTFYDHNGNMTSRFSGTELYNYDTENHLTSASSGITWNTAFVYDGLGRLRTRTEYSRIGTSWVVNTTTEYIYDGMRVIQERDISNNPTVSYTRGTDLSGSVEGAGGIGGMLARSSGYSAGNWTTHHFYHADGNGNITYLVDSSQGLAASYRYDPFGNGLSSSGSQAAANVYRYSSKEVHVNSGMVIYLYRFYDPSLQRWLNRDPIGEDGGVNLYEFNRNGPTCIVDPNGKNGVAIAAVCLAAAALVVYELNHQAHCLQAEARWQDSLAKCREQYNRVSTTFERELRFIETWGGASPAQAILNCARRHDPEAVQEMMKDCGKAAAGSEVGGSLPEVPGHVE